MVINLVTIVHKLSEVQIMTNREKIIELREKEKTYKEIAELGLAVVTVKCVCSLQKNRVKVY